MQNQKIQHTSTTQVLLKFLEIIQNQQKSQKKIYKAKVASGKLDMLQQLYKAKNQAKRHLPQKTRIQKTQYNQLKKLKRNQKQ